MIKQRLLLVTMALLAVNVANAAERKVIMPAGSSASPLFSPAIEANGFIFTSGQLALDPVTGAMPAGIEAQTKQAMANLQRVLAADGASLDDLVKINIYLKNLDDYEKMNAVYASHFKAAPPVRTALQVGKIPLDALIEIEGIAIKK